MRVYHSCTLLTRILSIHNRSPINRVELSPNDFDEVYKAITNMTVSLGAKLIEIPDEEGSIHKFKFRGITFRRCENIDDTGMLVVV